MKGFVQDIEGLAVKNNEFRRVLYTAKHCQLVVMALKQKEDESPRRRSGRRSTSLTSSFAWRRGAVRQFSMAFGRRSGRALR